MNTTAGATRGPTRAVVITVVAVIAVIVVLNLLARALDESVGGSEPSGEAGSSFATSSSGLAAYAQLLADYGHPIDRVRGDLRDASWPADATVFVTAPTGDALDVEDLDAIRAHATQGGRAVLVELDAFEIRTVIGGAPEVVAGVESYTDIAPGLAGIVRVRSDGTFGYVREGGAALVRESDNVLLTGVDLGAGDVYLLADAAPLENEWIGEADNAALGLALPSSGGGTVVFAEGVHGYGERTGVSAIPSRWKVALLAIALAGVVYAWARSRRLGPPDRPSRDLPPARAAYVDALAGTLERTDDRPAALEHLGAWVRSRVKQRGGLAADADDEAVTAAARRLGLDDDDIAALWHAPTDDAGVVRLGRVAARLTANEHEGIDA